MNLVMPFKVKKSLNVLAKNKSQSYTPGIKKQKIE